MKAFRNLFQNKTIEKLPLLFDGWPTEILLNSASIPEVFNRRLETSEALRVDVTYKGDYSPTLILALGKTGYWGLRQLLNQSDVYQAASAGILKIGLFLNLEDKGLELEGRTRKFLVTASQETDRRQAVFNSFDIDCLNPFKAWISDDIRMKNARIYLFCSLHDPLNGLLPRLLQVINLIGGFSTISVFLAAGLAANETGLSDAEAAGVLEELTRFCKKGDHVLKSLHGKQDTACIKDAELLHNLFLLGSDYVDALPGDYENTMVQALWESVYTLLHPSGKAIHRRLRKIIASSAIHSLNGVRLLSSCSVATLRAPLAELQKFVAARIAGMVLFDPAFGLFKDNGSADWEFAPENTHPFYSWLIEEDENIFQSEPFIPDKVENIIPAFEILIQNSLNRYLNFGGSLRGARNGMQTLSLAVTRIKVGANKAMKQSDGWKSLYPVIGNIQHQINMVIRSLENWRGTIFGTENVEAKHTTDGLANPLDILKSPDKNGPSLKDIVNEKEKKALDWLKTIGSRQYTYSVLDVKDEKKLEEFYTMALSVEEVKEFSDTLRQRFGWWCRWEGDEFKLSIVYLPDGWKPGLDKERACFKFSQGLEFFKAVFTASQLKAHAVSSHFTRDYFDGLLAIQRERLCCAGNIPFLGYDRKHAEEYQNLQNSKLGFLIGWDDNQANSMMRPAIDIFPKLATRDIKVVGGNESTRFTAFGLNSFIPLSDINIYKNSVDVFANHLFPHETFAQEYRGSLVNDGINPLFSAELGGTFWNRQLIMLFIRMLHYGLIFRDDTFSIGYGKPGGRWCVTDNDPFPQYTLAIGGQVENLLEAYQNFVLRFWVDPLRTFPEIKNDKLNPFLSENRVNYLNQLLKKCRDLSIGEQSLLTGEVVQWQMQLAQSTNNTYKQFAVIMAKESRTITRKIQDFSEPFFG